MRSTCSSPITASTPLCFDKFLPATPGPGPIRLFPQRRVVGFVARLAGTDVNRRLSDILNDTPGLQILGDGPSLLRGQYRIVLLRKQE